MTAVKNAPTINYPGLMATAQGVKDAEQRQGFETNIAFMLRDEIDSLDWQIRAKGVWSLSGRMSHFGSKHDVQIEMDQNGTANPDELAEADEAVTYCTEVFKHFAARQQALKGLYRKLTGVTYQDKATRIREAKASTAKNVDREAEALAAVA